MMRIKQTKGFTLLEVLLYVGITSMILLVLSASIFFFLNVRIKTQTVTEVSSETARSLETISGYIRTARSVILPTPGNTSQTLMLEMDNGLFDPIELSLSSGRIILTRGASAPVALTSTDVTVTNMSFTNLARTGTPDILQIVVTAAHQNTEGRNEYEFSTTATTSVSIPLYD